MRTALARYAFALPILLAGCARQDVTAVAPEAPGLVFGLWHGFIFPLAWIVSLFSDDVAVYAVPNNGGWYDFGFFLGIVVFGVGARKTRIVYRDRSRRPQDETMRPAQGTHEVRREEETNV